MKNQQAKMFFEKCRDAQRRIDQLSERMAMARALAQRVTASYSAMPGPGGAARSRTEEALVLLEEMQASLDEAVSQWAQHHERVMWVLDQLSEQRMRDVLTWRYIDGWSLDKIAREMGLCRRQVSRLLDQGLTAAQPHIALTEC